MIAVGFALSRIVFRDESFWIVVEKLTYFVLFPSLLFVTVWRTPIVAGTALPVLGAVLGAIAVGIILGYAAQPILRPNPRQFASGVQCAFRFNSYVFLALSYRLSSGEGLALSAVILGVAVPILNIAAVWPLARNTQGRLLGELARNPLLVATLAGLLANMAGLPLPALAVTTFERLGAASLALGLLSVGAGLRLGAIATGDAASRSSAVRLAVWLTSVKLIAMPLAALALVRWMDLNPVAAAIVVAYAALPTAPSAYILASRMGGDGPLVAALISLSLIGSAFALPFWLAML